MVIDVIPTVDQIRTEDLYSKTVVILDVLRTSSTIITALANSSKIIIPVETVVEAKQLKIKNPSCILAGDRFYKKIPGFDLGNSPTSFLETSFWDQAIVLTTTNGTRAIQKALKGEKVLIGGFLNGKKCSEEAIALRRDIVLLAVGERDEFSLEDGLAAGFFIDLIKNTYKDPLKVNDLGIAMYGLYKYYENQLFEVITESRSGKKLIQMGYEEDIRFSCQKNIFPFCPVVKDDQTITVKY